MRHRLNFIIHLSATSVLDGFRITSSRLLSKQVAGSDSLWQQSPFTGWSVEMRRSSRSFGAEGNHRSGVTLAMGFRVQWYHHLRTQNLGKEDKHPAYTPLGVHGNAFTFVRYLVIYLKMCNDYLTWLSDVSDASVPADYAVTTTTTVRRRWKADTHNVEILQIE